MTPRFCIQLSFLQACSTVSGISPAYQQGIHPLQCIHWDGGFRNIRKMWMGIWQWGINLNCRIQWFLATLTMQLRNSLPIEPDRAEKTSCPKLLLAGLWKVWCVRAVSKLNPEEPHRALRWETLQAVLWAKASDANFVLAEDVFDVLPVTPRCCYSSCKLS